MNIYCKKMNAEIVKLSFLLMSLWCDTKNAAKKLLIYPGVNYALRQHIFEELEYIGIKVDDDLRFHPYFITYDFESLLVTYHLTQIKHCLHSHSPTSKALKLMNIKHKRKAPKWTKNLPISSKLWQDQGMRNMKDYLK